MINYNELILHKCSNKDINDILLLQQEVIDTLIDPSVLRVNSEEMFLSCMIDPSISLGLYHHDKLVALIIMVDAHGTNEDLSIGLEKFTVEKSANFKLVLVHPNYRGNHFMSSLMHVIDHYAYQLGYTHLCVTVSPDNSYSLDNILANHYQIDHTAIKYGGLKRNVCVKQIETPSFQIPTTFETCFRSLEKPFIYGSIVILKDGKKAVYQGQMLDNIKELYIPTNNESPNF